MTGSNKTPAIIIILYIVILVSYFMVFQQYWFMKLLGGTVIRIWIPNLLILCLVGIRYAITNRGPVFSVKKDLIYPLKVTLMILLIWDSFALRYHDEGLWYVGKMMLVSFSPICLAIAIVLLVRNDFVLNRILGLLFFCGLLMTLNVELRFLSGDPSFETLVTSHGYEIETYEEKLLLAGSEGIYRHGEQALGINTYAAMLIPLPLIGFYLSQRSSKRLIRFYYYFSSLFFFYAISVTMSRAAFIANTISAVVFFLLRYLRSSKIKFMAYSLIVFLIFNFMLLGFPGMKIRLFKMFAAAPVLSDVEYVYSKLYDYGVREKQYFEPHFGRFGSSYDFIKESPIFGVGWTRQYLVNEHNHYVQQAAIYGLISVAIYITFFITMVCLTWTVLKRMLRGDSSDASLGTLLFACTIAFLFYLNASPGENLYVWVLFGLNIAWTKYTHEKERSYGWSPIDEKNKAILHP